MSRGEATDRAALRALPSIDEVLRSPAAAALAERDGRERVAELLRAELERWRAEVLDGRSSASEVERRLASGALVAAVERGLAADALRAPKGGRRSRAGSSSCSSRATSCSAVRKPG